MAQVKKSEVRERILAAAAGLFAERGYAGATIGQIAKAAGIAPSSVYVYFKSKLEIVFAIYDPWLKEHLELLAREVEALATAEAKVFRVVQKLWRDIPADRNGFANNLIQAISSATPEDCYDPALLRWTEQKIASLLRGALPPGPRRRDRLHALRPYPDDGLRRLRRELQHQPRDLLRRCHDRADVRGDPGRVFQGSLTAGVSSLPARHER